jgi:hypothetical protein
MRGLRPPALLTAPSFRSVNRGGEVRETARKHGSYMVIGKHGPAVTILQEERLPAAARFRTYDG